VYSFLVCAHNLQILRIKQGSTPRIDRSFWATLLFDAITNVKRCTLSLLVLYPHHGRLFRPLIPIVISVTTVRRHDVALPSISATVFTTPKPHELTIVELRVAYTRYPTGSTVRYGPATVIKWNPYPEPPMRKLHFHPSSALSLSLFLLQLALTTLSLAISSIYSIPRRANCSSVFVPDVEEKAQSRL
jgi:hypothetical protein